MTEQRLRYIKDGKVVGYCQILPDNIVYFEFDGETSIITNTPFFDDGEPDSFDLGIKVGEDTCIDYVGISSNCQEHKAEWFFSGDIFEAPPADGCTNKRVVMLAYGQYTESWHPTETRYGWHWVLDDGDMVTLWREEITKAKKIGTIYDKEAE